mgnify:CR=1 FL=1
MISGKINVFLNVRSFLKRKIGQINVSVKWNKNMAENLKHTANILGQIL